MTWLRRARFVVARWLPCALVLASLSCAGLPGGGQSTAGHGCADKVAQVTISASVPGLWNCLAPSLQLSLHALGQDGDGALIKSPFAIAYHYIGSSSDVAYYELVLTAAVAAQVQAKTIPLTVWVDSGGKVTNVGVSTPTY